LIAGLGEAQGLRGTGEDFQGAEVIEHVHRGRRSVATQLQHGLSASDIIGRSGGDEFIVIALGTPSGQPGEGP